MMSPQGVAFFLLLISGGWPWSGGAPRFGSAASPVVEISLPLGRLEEHANNATSALMARKLEKGTMFFAQDDNGDVIPLLLHPNSDTAYQTFSSATEGYAKSTEDFDGEEFKFMTKPEFTIGTVPITASVSELKKPRVHIDTDRAQNGMYPISGRKFLRIRKGSRLVFRADYGARWLGFGFYGTDLLDENLNRRVTVLTSNADGSNKKRYRLKARNEGGVANGAVFFFGVYDDEGFEVVRISNGKSDGFGIDDVTMVSTWPESICGSNLAQQVVSTAEEICDGATLEPGTQYTLTSDVTCADAGPTLGDGACLDCTGHTITGPGVATGSIGANMPSSASTLFNCGFSSWTYGVRVFGPNNIMQNIETDSCRNGVYDVGIGGTTISCSKMIGTTSAHENGILASTATFGTTVNAIESVGTNYGVNLQATGQISCADVNATVACFSIAPAGGLAILSDSLCTGDGDGLSFASTGSTISVTGVTACTGGACDVCDVTPPFGGPGTVSASNLMCTDLDAERLTCDAGVCPTDTSTLALPETCSEVCSVVGLKN